MIIADEEALDENYIPLTIPCREFQKKELAYWVSRLEKGVTFDCLCYGKPGTGKTLLVKYVLDRLLEEIGVSKFYVNCWEKRTLAEILDDLLVQAEIPVVSSSCAIKYSRLKKLIKPPIIIALDEVDKLKFRELNDTLYLLKTLNKVGLILISNSRRCILNLDPRVESRLNLHLIHFPPYSQEELMFILKHRVVDCKALYPGTWSIKVLELISKLANGDARAAIQTLRNAAQIAEDLGRSKITTEDVVRARKKVEEVKRRYRLKALGEHYELIYKIIEENDEITSRELFLKYKEKCLENGLNPKSYRSLNNYIQELIRMGYIRVERVNRRGNIRRFVVK